MSDRKNKRIAARILARSKVVHVDSTVERIKPLLKDLQGVVLEIGPGSGDLIKHLPKGIAYVALEPNPHLDAHLRSEFKRSGLSGAHVLAGHGEHIPLSDESVDAVISVRTLCAMKDLPRALAEIRRVLKPGGTFIFGEHVAAPRGNWRRLVQLAARPLWRHLSDCDPAAEIGPAIERAGFRSVSITPFRIGGRRNIVVRLRIFGTARK
jgi:ubiquinone/menaquinone biosynthesis C-methylase UbiE